MGVGTGINKTPFLIFNSVSFVLLWQYFMGHGIGGYFSFFIFFFLFKFFFLHLLLLLLLSLLFLLYDPAREFSRVCPYTREHSKDGYETLAGVSNTTAIENTLSPKPFHYIKITNPPLHFHHRQYLCQAEFCQVFYNFYILSTG